MRKSKCPKTMSGKHIWKKTEDLDYVHEKFTYVDSEDTIRAYIYCQACEVINDLKEDDR